MRGGLGPNYWRLWTATVSNFGDGVTLIAGPLLAGFFDSGSGAGGGDRLCPAAAVAALLAYKRRAGGPARPPVAYGGGGRVPRGAAMFPRLCGSTGLREPPLLYGIFFVMGTAETLFDTASVSILPAVVARESLEKANGRLFGAQIVANEFVARRSAVFCSRSRLPSRSSWMPGLRRRRGFRVVHPR